MDVRLAGNSQSRWLYCKTSANDLEPSSSERRNLLLRFRRFLSGSSSRAKEGKRGKENGRRARAHAVCTAPIVRAVSTGARRGFARKIARLRRNCGRQREAASHRRDNPPLFVERTDCRGVAAACRGKVHGEARLRIAAGSSA